MATVEQIARDISESHGVPLAAALPEAEIIRRSLDSLGGEPLGGSGFEEEQPTA